MGSSTFFTAISLIVFVITFGIVFQFVPMILGAVFTVIGTTMQSFDMDAGWLAVYTQVNTLSQYLVPLVAGLLMVLLVLKTLMAAGVRGFD